MGLGRQGILDHSGEPTWKMKAPAFMGYKDRDHRPDRGLTQVLRLMGKRSQWGSWA